MCTYFTTETDAAQNLIDNFFFLIWTVKRSFHRKGFKWKKYGGTGLISEKTEVLYAEFNERAEAVTSRYLQQVIFYNIFILCLWLRITTKSDQGV